MESFYKTLTVSCPFSIGSSPLERVVFHLTRRKDGAWGWAHQQPLCSQAWHVKMRSYYEKMRSLDISHSMETWSFLLKNCPFWRRLTLFILSPVARHQLKTWFLWHISDKRASSSSNVAQFFQMMWLNATRRTSAVHPSSICLQKGLITMGSSCPLLLETPCSNYFGALQESAAEKCLLHILCG